VIGGAAGALPPLIGWAAVTGDIGWGAVALFAIIFSGRRRISGPVAVPRRRICRRRHPDAAGPSPGLRETKRQMLLYTLMLWPVSLAPWLLGLAGPVYAGSVAALSLAFTGAAIRVWRDETDRSARQISPSRCSIYS